MYYDHCFKLDRCMQYVNRYQPTRLASFDFSLIFHCFLNRDYGLLLNRALLVCDKISNLC